MKILHRIARFRPSIPAQRRGNIVVLACAFFVAVLGFTAFAVDIGYISLTRAQLQNATDAAALAACIELGAGLGPSANPTQTTVAANATQAATSVAGANPAGNMSSVYLNTGSDIEFGRRSWNAEIGDWQDSWGTHPYNLARVTANRGRGAGSAGDAPLPLFFARVIGHNSADVQTSSKAALLSAVGFKLDAGSSQTVDILPIAYDEPSWNDFMAGNGPDNYSYNPSTGAITAGSDGVKEISLYPYGNQSLTPGNRGTVDIGSSNNSTADLSRQIRYGVNANDLSYIGGSIRTDQGPLSLNGDTGISAGIKDDLESIKGQPRAIPIFTSVTGPGNNATYTIVKFVGIRIMYVKLTGGSKTVVAQPAPLVSRAAIPGPTTSATTFIYSAPRLVQ